jgi:hypothetical protein
MNKKIIIFCLMVISPLLHSMEQSIILFDQLPKHELNCIAAYTKRSGKDTLRCVNKHLNNKIISQDQLYVLYAQAKESKNEMEMRMLSKYSTFTPYIAPEIIDAIQDNNEKLTTWCLNKMPLINVPFLEISCMEAAIKKGNLSMVRKLFTYCRDDLKYSAANHIVIFAAKHGHLDIIKAFIESYKSGIDFSAAIYFAKNNGHCAIAEYLESKKPSWRYPSEKKSERY